VIAAQILEIYPDGEYLFMRWGKPIVANTFNKELWRVCEKLDIPYRSSHQIRFTTATRLFEHGVKLNQISTILGHSNIGTTLRYIRQQKTDEESFAIMTAVLDV